MIMPNNEAPTTSAPTKPATIAITPSIVRMMVGWKKSITIATIPMRKRMPSRRVLLNALSSCS